jgi:hypothetical protein
MNAFANLNGEMEEHGGPPWELPMHAEEGLGRAGLEAPQSAGRARQPGLEPPVRTCSGT